MRAAVQAVNSTMSSHPAKRPCERDQGCAELVERIAVGQDVGRRRLPDGVTPGTPNVAAVHISGRSARSAVCEFLQPGRLKSGSQTEPTAKNYWYDA
jgi:hypothetical protein